MLDLIRRVTYGQPKHTDVEFQVGDNVEVSVKVREGEKERIQIFKGVVTRLAGAGASRSFTVRKISDGVGVERTFPFQSPSVDKIRVISRGKVRKARLFYLRNLAGKAARIDSELVIEGAPSKSAGKTAAAKN